MPELSQSSSSVSPVNRRPAPRTTCARPLPRLQSPAHAYPVRNQQKLWLAHAFRGRVAEHQLGRAHRAGRRQRRGQVDALLHHPRHDASRTAAAWCSTATRRSVTCRRKPPPPATRPCSNSPRAITPEHGKLNAHPRPTARAPARPTRRNTTTRRASTPSSAASSSSPRPSAS